VTAACDTHTIIVHLDIDAFFASVEQVLIPALRGRPVAVGSGCIASCSYEARAYGLHAAMSLAAARRLCPELAVLPGSYGVYRCFTARIWDLCREVSPAVETYLDDAYLDMSGTELLYGDVRARIQRLRERIRDDTGLTVTAGLGPNRMIARLTSRCAKPDGLGVTRPCDVDAFLLERPVGDIPGIGPRTAEVLHKFNVRLVRELRELSRESLMSIFGKNGSAIFDRARGLDTRAVSAREVPKTISRESTFHKETTDPAEIRSMLHYLVERAMKAVRELGLLARTVSVKIRYNDFKGDEARARLIERTRLEGDVMAAALALVERLHARRVSVRLVGVALSGLSLDDADQLELFGPDDEEERRTRLAEALDELRGRFGFSSVTAGKSIGLLGKLKQDANGYVLRTPCLTK
jgi:DNA polymerase-4